MDLAESHPDLVTEPGAAFDQWLAPMADPIKGDTKRADVESATKPLTDREKQRERIGSERKKQREALKKAEKAKAPGTDSSGSGM